MSLAITTPARDKGNKTMKTIWTKPGTGSLPIEMREAIKIAWPESMTKKWVDAAWHLDHLPQAKRTRLELTTTGALEEYDLDRMAAI